MSALRTVLRLAVPMTLAEVVVLAVPQAVVALMGRMEGQALYVRALFAPLVFVFVAVQAGVGTAAQVATARGADRRYAGAGGTVTAMAFVAAVVLVVAGALLALLAPGLARLFSVAAQERGEFVSFVRWVCLASVTAVGPTVCAAVLRGMGRVRSAAGVAAVMAVLEVGGVAVLGLPGTAGWGIWSVPVAAGAAGIAGGVTGLWLLGRAGVRPLALTRDLVRAARPTLLRVGVPVATSYLVIFAGSLVLTWVVSVFGTSVVSGFAVANTLQSLVIVPGVAIGSATAILVNQYYGAGGRERVTRTVRAGLLLAGGLYAVVGGASWLLREPLVRVVAGDAAVAREAARYLEIVAPTYLVMGLVLASLTLLEQIGGGALAILLNGAYFGGICAVGGWLARDTGDPLTLYRTVAAANLSGITAVVIVSAYARRWARRAGAGAERTPREAAPAVPEAGRG